MAKIIRKNIYFPVTLSIELVNGCINRCFFCNSSSDIHLMPYPVLDSIIDGLSDVKVDNITPFGIGESTIHPLLMDFIEKLLKRNESRCSFNDLVLNTSGIGLDTNRLMDILDRYPESRFHRIHFSLDASFQNTWEKIGKTSSLAAVKQRITSVAKWKRKTGNKEPFLTVSLILHNLLGEEEIEEFKNCWKSFFKQFDFDCQICSTWPDHDRNAIYLRADSRIENSPANSKCSKTDYMIKSDGRVYGCVRGDIPFEDFFLGDLGKQSLQSILNYCASAEYQNHPSRTEFCRNCLNGC